MSPICMHCILNTNATNIINLTLDITHIPHRHSLWQVVLVVEDIVTFRWSELHFRTTASSSASYSMWYLDLRSIIILFSFFFFFCHCMLILVHVSPWQSERDTIDKRHSKSHEIIMQSVGLVHTKVLLPSQSGIVFPIVGISLPPIVIWKTR